mmetsp:Transcript_154295/g.494829  ORF Transcript_154295/g.494829 Transcript_154295/m.494829 type:complete len:274 (-) Transcript_154295:747-1568(-)
MLGRASSWKACCLRAAFACHTPVAISSAKNVSNTRAAAPTPSSPRSCSPSACALATSAASAVTFVSAAARARPLTLLICGRPTPAPDSATIWAFRNWSKPQGVTMLGRPLLRAAAVVPEPPWWTMAEHCGNNHSWGAVLTKRTLSLAKAKSSLLSGCPFSFSALSPAQPPNTTPLSPASFSERTARHAMCSGETASMEPQPMYTGALPPATNSASTPKSAPPKDASPFAMRRSCSARGTTQKPVNTGWTFQSDLGVINAELTPQSCGSHCISL